MTGIRFLQCNEQNVVQTVAMETSNGFEIGGKRLAMTLLQRSDELLCGLLRDFLDLFCFHFRSPVRGFGSIGQITPTIDVMASIFSNVAVFTYNLHRV